MSTVYLTIALPELQVAVPLEINRSELDFMLDQNLLQHERHDIDDTRRLFDIINAIRWMQKRPLSHQGTIVPIEDYEIALLQKDEKIVPPFIIPFLEQYSEARTRKEKSEALLFSYLQQFFPSEEFQAPTNHRLHPTVLKIYEIEHFSRLLFAYLRAVDSKKEEDMEKYEKLGKLTFDCSFKTHDEVPELYKPLYQMWHELKEAPLQLHQAYIQWKFDALESLLAKTCTSIFTSFGLDQIIVYCAQYDLLEAEERKKPTSTSFIDRILYKAKEK